MRKKPSSAETTMPMSSFTALAFSAISFSSSATASCSGVSFDIGFRSIAGFAPVATGGQLHRHRHLKIEDAVVVEHALELVQVGPLARLEHDTVMDRHQHVDVAGVGVLVLAG